jgi:hypothetical protein
MKRGPSTKKIWLRQTPSFKFRPTRAQESRHHALHQQQRQQHRAAQQKCGAVLLALLLV